MAPTSYSCLAKRMPTSTTTMPTCMKALPKNIKTMRTGDQREVATSVADQEAGDGS